MPRLLIDLLETFPQIWLLFRQACHLFQHFLLVLLHYTLSSAHDFIQQIPLDSAARFFPQVIDKWQIILIGILKLNAVTALFKFWSGWLAPAIPVVI